MVHSLRPAAPPAPSPAGRCSQLHRTTRLSVCWYSINCCVRMQTCTTGWQCNNPAYHNVVQLTLGLLQQCALAGAQFVQLGVGCWVAAAVGQAPPHEVTTGALHDDVGCLEDVERIIHASSDVFLVGISLCCDVTSVYSEHTLCHTFAFGGEQLAHELVADLQVGHDALGFDHVDHTHGHLTQALSRRVAVMWRMNVAMHC